MFPISMFAAGSCEKLPLRSSRPRWSSVWWALRAMQCKA